MQRPTRSAARSADDCANDTTLADFLGIIERLGLSDTEVAVLARVSPHTARIVRIARAMPGRVRTRAALAEFTRKNRHARSRADLRVAAAR